MMRENAEERNMRQKTSARELEPALLYLIYGNEQQGKRRALRSGIGRRRETLSCARSRRHVSAFACNPCTA
jgi:hypothetical protein